MPYRNVYIGDGETVIARVPKEVIDEWLENRERNRHLGYPDRPPDIDTDLLRTWITHPTEKDFAEALSKRMGRKVGEAFPVYSAATQLFSLEAKVLVTYESEDYYYRFVVRDIETGQAIVDKEARSTNGWNEEAFEGLLSLYHDLFVEDNENSVLITTYFDFMELESEFDIAYKDLEDFYGQEYDFSSTSSGMD